MKEQTITFKTFSVDDDVSLYEKYFGEKVWFHDDECFDLDSTYEYFDSFCIDSDGKSFVSDDGTLSQFFTVKVDN